MLLGSRYGEQLPPSFSATYTEQFEVDKSKTTLQAAEMAATATRLGPAGVKSVPIFTLAATTGQGLSILHTFLSHLQPRHPPGTPRLPILERNTPADANEPSGANPAAREDVGGITDTCSAVGAVDRGGLGSAESVAVSAWGNGRMGGEELNGARPMGDALTEAKVSN